MRVVVGDLALDLTDDQIEQLREQLQVQSAMNLGGMLSTEQAAERLGFSVEFVREHAVELGGRKMGAGPKARWRFPAASLDTAGASSSGGSPVEPSAPARRRAPRRAGSGQLLKSRG